jgi:hypothetical protein
VQGSNYGHERCPVDASTPSHGEPVFIGKDGIFCHKCAASGNSLGCRRAGFFSWTALVGGGVSSLLRTAVSHFCHWQHAQFIMAEDVGLTDAVARKSYAALLKAAHGPRDPRVRDAMRRGNGLVRMNSYWAPANLSRPHKSAGLVDRLRVLPALFDQIATDGAKPSLMLSEERLGIFQGIDDLSAYGYPRIVPVRGMKVHGHFQAYSDLNAVHAVVLPEHLQREERRAFRPRYLPPTKRMSKEQANAIVEKSFPGINHAYLQLLIAARGFAEAGIGQPPRIAVDGPSGAGKDTIVKIAAMMLGDNHWNVAWTPDAKELVMSLWQAATNAGLATMSEIIKNIHTKKVDVLLAFSPLLTFEIGMSARVLHEGYVSIRQVPVMVVTDTSYPPEVRNDQQIGRRFVHVRLERAVDWERTAGDLQHWRVQSEENSTAANSIISHVIDEFFAGDEPMVFNDVARKLGFRMLNEIDDAGLDPRDDLLRLLPRQP